MPALAILKKIWGVDDDYYPKVISVVPHEFQSDVSVKDIALLRQHLGNDYVFLEVEPPDNFASLLAEANEKETLQREAARKAEERRNKYEKKRREQAATRKAKQLEKLKKELGVA